jgi:hypothetical protein
MEAVLSLGRGVIAGAARPSASQVPLGNREKCRATQRFATRDVLRSATSRVASRHALSGTFQHELDHLDGKLFVDRVVDTSSGHSNHVARMGD